MATIVPGRKNPWNPVIILLNSVCYSFFDKKRGLTNRYDDTKWYIPIWHSEDRILIYFNSLKYSMPFWHRQFWRGRVNFECQKENVDALDTQSKAEQNCGWKPLTRKRGTKGTFVQNVHSSRINSSTGGLVSEATIRVTQELVTPR